MGAGLTRMAIPAVAVAVGAATASYYLVERPFLRRRSQPEAEVERGSLTLDVAVAVAVLTGHAYAVRTTARTADTLH